MFRNRWTHVMLATLLAALVVPAMTTPAAAQDDEELQHFLSWSRGDHWKWTKTPSPTVAAQTEGEYKWKVTGFERVTLSLWDAEKHPPEYQKHQVYRVKVWANQTANSAEGPVRIETEQDRYVRLDDMATVRVWAENDYVPLAAGAADLGGSRRDHQFFPPDIETQFPFGVGDKWRMYVYGLNWNPDSGSCGGENQPACRTHTDNIETYEVIRKEQVTVPAGTFDAWLIKNTHELKWDDPENRDAKRFDLIWWSPDACNMVKKTEHKSDRSLQFTHELVDYRCTGEAKADPDYDIYAYENFSSTRFHPERGLHRSDFLNELESMAGSAGGGGGGGAFIGEKLPGFELTFAVFALVAVAAVARRRD